MRIANPSFFAVMLLACFTVQAAEPLAVITTTTNPLNSIPADTLKLIYQRKNQIDAEGNRWIPLNLPVADPLRRGFSLAVFSELPEEQEDYWNIQYFNGITPPIVLASEEAILRFVAATKGAIGYIRKQKVDSRVKVLLFITPPTEK